MKKIIALAIGCLLMATAYSQKNKWQEMDDFHAIMSVTFHPSEENNLKPLKDSAGVLHQKAKKWKKSDVPSGYNVAITKPVLKRLVSECAAIKTAVKNKKPDNELKVMIAKAHDTFHEIMEKCRKESH